MVDHVPIIDSETNPGEPGKSSLFKRLWLNPEAIREGHRDGNAPPVDGAALDQLAARPFTIPASFGSSATVLGLRAVRLLNLRGAIMMNSAGTGTRNIFAQITSNGGASWGTQETIASMNTGAGGDSASFDLWVDLVTGEVVGYSQSFNISANIPAAGPEVDGIRFSASSGGAGTLRPPVMVVLRAGKRPIPT